MTTNEPDQQQQVNMVLGLIFVVGLLLGLAVGIPVGCILLAVLT